MDAELSFGRWLKQRRKALDLTQEALAERVACATETIRKIEGGRLRPSRQVAARLAEALDLALVEREAFVHMARGEGGGKPLTTPLSTAPLTLAPSQP